MVYRVTVGYNQFEFDDAEAAIKYAEQSKTAFVGDKYDKTLDVKITLMNVEQENEEE